MGSSWSRRDRIIRLAKLRGDKAALAIMEGERPDPIAKLDDWTMSAIKWVAYWNEKVPSLTESELRALWGDR